MQQDYQWFVEPFGVDTNQSVVKEVWADRDAIEGKEDDKGEPHNVYPISVNTARKLRNSAKNGLDFNLYRQKNGEPMKLASFPRRKAKARRKLRKTSLKMAS